MKKILFLASIILFVSCAQTKDASNKNSSSNLSNNCYWQQKVDYTMDIDMNVNNYQYKGVQKLVYTNNSPDVLNRVFYHLYFNAFQPGSQMDVRSLNIQDPDGRVRDRISKLKPNEIGYTIAKYGFDNTFGDVIEDDSIAGLDNSGQLIGATREEGPQRGRHIVFDGNDRIEIPNSKDINLTVQKERTVSLWFKVNDKSTDKKQILYEEGGNVRGLNAYVTNNKLYVGEWDETNRRSDWKSTWLETDALASNKWHHLAVVLEGDKNVASNALSAYLDGELFDQGAGIQLRQHPGGIGLGNINRGTQFHDGMQLQRNHGLAGALDNVAIFNDALTSQQVDTLASM